MHHYAIAIEYDGASFKGWQRQGQLSTVQLHVEAALSKVAAEPISVQCAGRTDKYVHATQQVASFSSKAVRSEYGWLMGVNGILPPEIRILWLKSVPAEFNARYSAISRRYHYYIYNYSLRPALQHRKVSWVCRPLNITAMRAALPHLLGEHDFSAFRASNCQSKTPIRTIYDLQLQVSGEYICVDIKANAFLYHMVRNIVGVLLEIGHCQRDPSWARQVLETRERRQAGITAKPYGLYLVEVEYPKRYNLPIKAAKAAFSGFNQSVRETNELV